jgi:hypothetical protein
MFLQLQRSGGTLLTNPEDSSLTTRGMLNSFIFPVVPNWNIGRLSGFFDHTHTDTR